jgi:hypothetical protein
VEYGPDPVRGRQVARAAARRACSRCRTRATITGDHGAPVGVAAMSALPRRADVVSVAGHARCAITGIDLRPAIIPSRKEAAIERHTDEVWREAPAKVADVGDDVAPEIG